MIHFFKISVSFQNPNTKGLQPRFYLVLLLDSLDSILASGRPTASHLFININDSIILLRTWTNYHTCRCVEIRVQGACHDSRLFMRIMPSRHNFKSSVVKSNIDKIHKRSNTTITHLSFSKFHVRVNTSNTFCPYSQTRLDQIVDLSLLKCRPSIQLVRHWQSRDWSIRIAGLAGLIGHQGYRTSHKPPNENSLVS